MKKFLTSLIYFLSIINISFANLENKIIPEQTLVINNSKSWKSLLFSILEYIRDSIFWLLVLIAIAVFIYIWSKLLMARWNPEEFKKALMHFVYAIVGLVIIALSWWVVKIVSSLNL